MADARLRLFAAVPLPPETQAALAGIAAEMRARLPGAWGDAVRWVDLRGAHLTLKFIGGWPAGDAPRLGDAIAAATAGCTPFELRLSSPGVFPERGAPRVLWVGVDGAVDRLAQLRDTVESALAAAGCKPERQPFRPHLTIARIPDPLPRRRGGAGVGTSREAAAGLRGAVDSIGPPDGAAFTVDRVVLFRSELTPRGSIYTPLAVAPLHAWEA